MPFFFLSNLPTNVESSKISGDFGKAVGNLAEKNRRINNTRYSFLVPSLSEYTLMRLVLSTLGSFKVDIN